MDDKRYEVEQSSSDVPGKEDAGRSSLEPREELLVDPARVNYSEEPAAGGNGDEPAQGFLELVYGVLFEPVKTLKKAAFRPPLTYALLLVTILGLAGVVMWLLTISRIMNQPADPFAMGNLISITRPVMILGAITVFLWGYIKWFSYSAFISLAAEMLGGTGRARSVAAIAGLSLAPTILMIPAQILNYYLNSALFIFVVFLAVWIWVIVLMVTGIREVHGLSTGRTLLVVISPALVLAVFACLLLAGMVAVALGMYKGMVVPGYF